MKAITQMANVDNLKMLGGNAFKNGQYTEAQAYYHQACNAAPDDAESWHMLAVLHDISGNTKFAEKCCRKVIELQPQSCTAHNNLGTLLKNRGLLTEAIECYHTALNISPEYAEAANNLATALRDQGDIEASLTYYRMAISLRPDYSDAYSNLGALQQERGQIADALRSYQHAVRLEPANAHHIFNFACGLSEAGKMEESATLFNKVLQLDPGNASAWDGLSHVQLELRKFEEAYTSGLQAIRLDPGMPRAYLHTGSALHALNRIEEATEIFNRALDIEPDNETARYFLASMGAEATPDKSPANYVRELFDGYAETFDDSLVNKLEYQTPTLLHKIARDHIDDCGSSLDIIDLGCGTGLCGPLFRPLAKHMVGVDLSSKMVAKAKERAVYDELLVDDLLNPLLSSSGGFDLILAADVFVYIGNLEPVFEAASSALRSGGSFIFSTELNESSEDVVLRESGRYAHRINYITRLANETGFSIKETQNCALRKEKNDTITGTVYILGKD